MTDHLTVNRVLRSASFYPMTFVYLAAVAMAAIVMQGWLSLAYGTILFSVFTLLALVTAAWKELRAVHTLVDGQRTELLSRIDQLTALLITSGVVVPAQGQAETKARDEAHPSDGLQAERQRAIDHGDTA